MRWNSAGFRGVVEHWCGFIWAAAPIFGLLAFAALLGPARAEPDAAGAEPSLCQQAADNDDSGAYFSLGDNCVKLSAGVSYSYQGAKQSAGVPRIVNRNGTISQSTMSQTATANTGLEMTRQTSLGEFKSTIAGEWSKSIGDGTTSGSAYFTGWSVGLGGLTAGYTGTLMGFWEGNFLTSASSPGRSATSIVYDHWLDDFNRVAIGVESSLPIWPNADTDIWSFDFSSPVFAMRWRHEADAFTSHVSGIVRRADFSNSPLLPFLPNTATSRTGWAASFGMIIPVQFVGDSDQFSFQTTYAVDASSYLGTTNDLVVYQSVIRSTGPTKGWSAVAAYHHDWSEAFESNIFASYVTIEAELLAAKPTSDTFRSAVNLFWKPRERLKFGVELGYVDIAITPNGFAGYFNGNSGRSYIGTLSVSAEL